MKYYSIYADYRPNNPNRISYKVKIADATKISTLKHWWNKTYPWLKIYEIKPITEEEYKQGHNQLI